MQHNGTAEPEGAFSFPVRQQVASPTSAALSLLTGPTAQQHAATPGESDDVFENDLYSTLSTGSSSSANAVGLLQEDLAPRLGGSTGAGAQLAQQRASSSASSSNSSDISALSSANFNGYSGGPAAAAPAAWLSRRRASWASESALEQLRPPGVQHQPMGAEEQQPQGQLQGQGQQQQQGTGGKAVSSKPQRRRSSWTDLTQPYMQRMCMGMVGNGGSSSGMELQGRAAGAREPQGAAGPATPPGGSAFRFDVPTRPTPHTHRTHSLPASPCMRRAISGARPCNQSLLHATTLPEGGLASVMEGVAMMAGGGTAGGSVPASPFALPMHQAALMGRTAATGTAAAIALGPAISTSLAAAAAAAAVAAAAAPPGSPGMGAGDAGGGAGGGSITGRLSVPASPSLRPGGLTLGLGAGMGGLLGGTAGCASSGPTPGSIITGPCSLSLRRSCRPSSAAPTTALHRTKRVWSELSELQDASPSSYNSYYFPPESPLGRGDSLWDAGAGGSSNSLLSTASSSMPGNAGMGQGAMAMAMTSPRRGSFSSPANAAAAAGAGSGSAGGGSEGGVGGSSRLLSVGASLPASPGMGLRRPTLVV